MLKISYNENGIYAGEMSLTQSRLLKKMGSTPTAISIIPFFSKDYQETSNFIKNIYADKYDAHINVTYPFLMSIRDDKGRILAALGFRPSENDEAFFLEQYLTQPIDAFIGVPRSHIVEVGNLASGDKGAALYLFSAISGYLYHRGYSHVVLTGTLSLEKRFETMGLHPKRIAKADPDLLLEKDESWGRYYETQPHVIVGSLEHSYYLLHEKMGLTFRNNKSRLLPRLHYRSEVKR